MTQLPSWAVKLQSAWLGLGIFLTILAAQSGVNVPSQLLGLFTQGTWDVLATAATALFTAFQVIRTIFTAIPKSSISSLAVTKVRSFAWNPFRLSM